MKNFTFKVNTNTLFGSESLKQIPNFLEENNFRNIAIIIDANVEKSNYWQQFMEILKKETKIDIYYKNSMMEPTYEYLDILRKEFTADHDCIIGIGGGSTLDLAKAISVLVTNLKPSLEYRGHGLIEKNGIPLILVPSTSGSGSEITPFAVFIDKKEERKFGINSPLYLPVLSVIDPLLTVSCPKSVTISSGMDALTHTLESFVAKKHTVISRLLSKEAFQLIYNYLPKVILEPENIDYREKMSLGSYYAGMALFNSAAGTAGVLSYPIGTLFNVTHGLAGAVFLSPVIEFNFKSGYKDYEDLLPLINQENFSEIQNGNSLKFVNHFKDFVEKIGIPKKLNEFNIEKKDIPKILEHLKPLWGAVEQNPVEMLDSDIWEILDNMID